MSELESAGSPSQLGGMTVNERLSVAGLIERFDAAARGREESVMVAILRQVDLAEADAAACAAAILANPVKFGY